MDTMLPLVAGLAGTLIGSFASVVTIVVQSRLQAKRERTRDALNLAIEDWKLRIEHVSRQGGQAMPLSVFVHYHVKLIHLAEEGKLDPEAIDRLSAEHRLLVARVVANSDIALRGVK